MNTDTASHLNVEEELLENPEQFNSDDYEVFEDENGEIIVVEKDQLYGDDPHYQHEQSKRHFEEQQRERRQADPLSNTEDTSMQNQRGIRGGGETYVYGQSERRKRKNKAKANGKR